jgi:hypothetical protein
MTVANGSMLDRPIINAYLILIVLTLIGYLRIAQPNIDSCLPSPPDYSLGCAGAVRTLSSIVKAKIPTTTPSENSTGIL